MTDRNGAGSRGATGGVLVFLALLAIAVPVPSASGAEFGIESLSVRAIDAEGNPENLAGSHPDRLQIDFALSLEETGTTPRDLEFDLPPGLGSNANAVPQCPRELFDKGEECPAESQVGEISAGESETGVPLFAVEPGPGEIAALGSTPGFDIPLELELRPDDYGVTFKTNDLPEAAVTSGRVELWGVPADRQVGTSIPRRPFLTLPTRCEPLTVSFRTRSWQPGAPWLSRSADTGGPLGGCESLPFGPRLGLQLSNPVADSPTGARIELSNGESGDPDGRTSAQIRNMSIRLPEGITVSPGGAEGLGVCSDAQLGLGKTTPASCPPSSRVGTVEFDSPVAEKPFGGVVYLGEERPGERFRMFIEVSGPGIVVKFAGALKPDPSTGGTAISVRDLPQVPLSRLTLNMDGGPGAMLATPLECGATGATARFEPYSGGAPVDSAISLPIGPIAPATRCDGAAPFSPTLVVRSSNSRAGRPTTLSMRVHRRDGEQLPRRFVMTLPRGLSATIGAAEPCPEAAIAAAECPTASRVAGVLAEVGSGPDPAALRGDAYLTGPYRQAPFGMLLVFRAAIGPFDLGTLAVRAALDLDRGSGRVLVSTERLPAVVEGVPVRFRTIGLEMDRQGFAVNPTSCAPASADATIEAMGGASIAVKAPFVVHGCRRLGFKPRMGMTLTGRSELHRGGNPGFRVSARLRRGDANLRAMSVSFPKILDFNFSAVKEICARRAAIEGDCSDRSRVGVATARTPMLDEPLRGSMHVVQPKDDGLPDIWLSVASKGLNVDLVGETSLRDGRFKMELDGLPDLPMSAFSMRAPRGEEGLFSLGAGLCAEGRPRRLAIPVALDGQNGSHRDLRARIKARPRCAS